MQVFFSFVSLVCCLVWCTLRVPLYGNFFPCSRNGKIVWLFIVQVNKLNIICLKTVFHINCSLFCKWSKKTQTIHSFHTMSAAKTNSFNIDENRKKLFHTHFPSSIQNTRKKNCSDDDYDYYFDDSICCKVFIKTKKK